MARAFQGLDDVFGDSTGPRAVETVRRGDDNRQRNVTLAELLVQQRSGPGRLGTRVLEPTLATGAGNGYPERADHGGQQHRENEHPSRSGDGDPGDAGEQTTTIVRVAIRAGYSAAVMGDPAVHHRQDHRHRMDVTWVHAEEVGTKHRQVSGQAGPQHAGAIFEPHLVAPLAV